MLIGDRYAPAALPAAAFSLVSAFSTSICNSETGRAPCDRASEPIKVDYLMQRSGDSWLISDIYLDGAISEVATRRSEFAAILRNEGIDGLIAALHRKADLLTGTAVSAL